MRMKEVINQLILHDQTAYVKGRYIGESIRFIQDLMDYADREDEHALIFLSDIEKTFDSVSHNFVLAVFKSLISVSILFNGSESYQTILQVLL